MGVAETAELIGTVLFIALLWGGGCIRAPDGGSLANKVMAAINEDEEDKKDP